jgi:hypothetical protein
MIVDTADSSTTSAMMRRSVLPIGWSASITISTCRPFLHQQDADGHAGSPR